MLLPDLWVQTPAHKPGNQSRKYHKNQRRQQPQNSVEQISGLVGPQKNQGGNLLRRDQKEHRRNSGANPAEAAKGQDRSKDYNRQMALGKRRHPVRVYIWDDWHNIPSRRRNKLNINGYDLHYQTEI